MVSQEYRDGYDCYGVEHECQKCEKYFISLSCGCGLPKIEVGLHKFCDMTQPKHCLCVTGLVSPTVVQGMEGLDCSLQFAKVFSQSRVMQVMENQKREG